MTVYSNLVNEWVFPFSFEVDGGSYVYIFLTRMNSFEYFQHNAISLIKIKFFFSSKRIMPNFG